jgi:uncharacterized membrane protein YbhN (UPF0104 family)
VIGGSRESLVSRVAPFVGTLIFLAALWALWKTLSGIRTGDIKQALHALSWSALGRALLLTGMNYFVLTGQDWLAMKYVRRNIGYSRVSLAAFISYAFSNGLGFATITSASVRLRLYSGWGLDGVEIAKVISFCTLTMCLGLVCTAGVSFLFRSPLVPTHGIASLIAVRIAGVLLLCLVFAYLLLCALHRRSYSFRTWDLSIPSLQLSIAQVLLSCLDWAIAASVLYVLIPTGYGVTYFQFIPAFLVAQTVAILSQVPGGLGVLESAGMILLLPLMPARSAIASLVAYRAIYYLLPLIMAAGLLGARETLDRRKGARRLAGLIGRW